MHLRQSEHRPNRVPERPPPGSNRSCRTSPALPAAGAEKPPPKGRAAQARRSFHSRRRPPPNTFSSAPRPSRCAQAKAYLEKIDQPQHPGRQPLLIGAAEFATYDVQAGNAEPRQDAHRYAGVSADSKHSACMPLAPRDPCLRRPRRTKPVRQRTQPPCRPPSSPPRRFPRPARRRSRRRQPQDDAGRRGRRRSLY